jgi:hypothetical protein
MFACGSALDTDESRASANLPRALAKGDGSSSCQGFCGKKAPGGCWCDDKCDFYGDCCVDKAPVCDGAAGSCVGACGGKSKDGCWCDDKCELYGDCCGDEKKVCGAGGPLADCQQDSDCQAGLRCEGIPQDGSTKLGRCVDPKPQTGEGDSCSSSAPCKNSELICVGEVSMGSGSCSPAWMARSLSDNKLGYIRDNYPKGLQRSLVAYGLATVPVDIEVELSIKHGRTDDLRITLIDPNGVEGLVWDRTRGPLEPRMRVTGIPGDDNVNGRWTLKVVDQRSGKSGVLDSWTLHLTSRWD